MEKVKEKREAEEKNAIKNKQKSKYTYEEKYYRNIYFTIKKWIEDKVKESMKNGFPPPEINHYYYYYYFEYNFDGVDITEYNGLHETNFTVFRGKPNELLYDMKDKLEEIIKNKIGYKCCEVKLIDKIEKVDEPYTGLFGGKKRRIVSYPGKALWVHASMNSEGFYDVKCKGYKVRYDGPICNREDSGHYGREKYKACKESGIDPYKR